MTGGELFQSYFGLDRLTPNPAGELMRQYRVLAQHPSPSEYQLAEKARIHAELLRVLEMQQGPAFARETIRSLELKPEFAS